MLMVSKEEMLVICTDWGLLMWKDPIVKGGTEELGDKFGGDNSVEC